MLEKSQGNEAIKLYIIYTSTVAYDQNINTCQQEKGCF